MGFPIYSYCRFISQPAIQRWYTQHQDIFRTYLNLSQRLSTFIVARAIIPPYHWKSVKIWPGASFADINLTPKLHCHHVTMSHKDVTTGDFASFGLCHFRSTLQHKHAYAKVQSISQTFKIRGLRWCNIPGIAFSYLQEVSWCVNTLV